MAIITDIVFDYVPAQDIDAALEIETQEYPPDEAGSKESFSLRQSLAGDLFLGAYQTNQGSRSIIGYVCSTLSPAASLTHESMSNHVPNSSSVCIHSVCVSSAHQRQGVGSGLLKEYVARLESAKERGSVNYERILLIAHENLRGFYEKAGFEWLGKSEVVHGSKPWFEMRRILAAPSAVSSPNSTGTQQLPPGILEALQRRPQNVPTSRPFADFHHGVKDLIEEDPSKQPGRSVNKYDISCPRAECGSLILKKGVGSWVERASVQMEPANQPPIPLLPSLPVPPETAQWWLITPSPMEFENIGFTQAVQPSPSGKRLKLLTCGECDLGPLGWSEPGGNEFWLACSRAGYRT